MSTETVPKGYKRTEVGVIPEEWTDPTLNSLAANRPNAIVGGPFGSDLVSKDYTTSGVPIIRGQNMGGLYVSGEFAFISNAKAKTLQANMARPSDILFTQRGTLGQVSLVPYGKFGEYIISQSQMKLTLDDAAADPKYVYQYFNSAAGARQIIDSAIQTGVPHTNLGILRAYRIPLPPKPEQQAIATALSDADALIESLESLLAKKHQIKQGAMQELLTGKRRLPGFTGKWVDEIVGNVITKHFCGPSPTCDERNIENESEWGVLKTTAITWSDGWDWTKHKVLPVDYWGKNEIMLEVGDVLVTKAGPRHRVGVAAWIDFVPRNVIPSGKMIALRPNPYKVVPMMLVAAIASKEAQVFLDQRTTGMAESQLNFENDALLQTPLVLPSIQEQSAIATVLSDMDAELEALEAKLDKARQVKQGMMQQLLTGKVRLI